MRFAGGPRFAGFLVADDADHAAERHDSRIEASGLGGEAILFALPRSYFEGKVRFNRGPTLKLVLRRHRCSAVTNGGGSTVDSDSFAPRAADRGDVARMILYMAVRYEGDDGFADLEPNEKVNNGSNPYMGKLSVLKAWNEADPPSAFEENRNQVIYDTYQHNRNPFIDHPEWVEAIW